MVADPPVVDPDAVDEDPEEHMGAVIPDPWADKSQTDWPDNEDETDDEDDEEPADAPADSDFVDDRDNVSVID